MKVLTQSKSKTQITRRVHGKFNCITVKYNGTRHVLRLVPSHMHVTGFTWFSYESVSQPIRDQGAPVSNYPSGDLRSLVICARTLLSSFKIIVLGESGKCI